MKFFFPQSIDLRNYDDLMWMLHELEHVRQYKVHGFEGFMIKYFANIGWEIIRHGSLNIHDNIGLEEDATNKARRICDEVHHAYCAHQAARP